VQQAITAILNDNDIRNESIPLSTLINFNDSCLEDEVPALSEVPSNRPKSGKRPKSAKKKKASEWLDKCLNLQRFIKLNIR